MGYNDSNRIPKIDEIAYVAESGKQGAPWRKGKIVGINHDDQQVLVECEPDNKIIKSSTTSIMFGQDPFRTPETTEVE